MGKQVNNFNIKQNKIKNFIITHAHPPRDKQSLTKVDT